MVGAEMPSNSDLIKWAEQGRLHTKYTNVTSAAAAAANTAVLTINDTLVPGGGTIALRVGQTQKIRYETKNTATCALLILARPLIRH